MRIRTIKPEFWESENLGKVSRDARLLFIGLFSCFDDSGRTRASSRLLASRLFPYDEGILKALPLWMDELVKAKCVRVYSVEGETYLDIPKWLSHQKIDKPSPSKLPEFREDSRGFEKNSLGMGTGILGTGNREQGTGSVLEASPPAVEEIEDMPQGLNTAEFKTAWSQWKEARKAMGKKPKSWLSLFNSQLQWLTQYPPQTAKEIIELSTINNWQGLQPPRNGSNRALNGRGATVADQRNYFIGGPGDDSPDVPFI